MKVLIENSEIEKRIKELGKQISNDYQNEKITIVVTLKGAFMVAATLAKYLTGDIRFEFIRISSYENTKSTGNLKIKLDIENDLSGKNILIVEDIVDTGNTLYYLKNEYIKRNAKSVKICSLLNKQSRRIKDVKVDYMGFDIEDKFVVGYGLDYNEEYRQLPYIGYIE